MLYNYAILQFNWNWQKNLLFFMILQQNFLENKIKRRKKNAKEESARTLSTFHFNKNIESYIYLKSLTLKYIAFFLILM